MIELEIYACGLPEMGKILEMGRQLVEIAGLRYKLDTNHDIVYLEFDEPTLSVCEIRAFFSSSAFNRFLSGRFRRSFSRETKTKLLKHRDVFGDQGSEIQNKTLRTRVLAVH